MKKTATPRTALAAGVAKVLQRLHYPLDVMLLGSVAIRRRGRANTIVMYCL
jgi:hypothetical protein